MTRSARNIADTYVMIINSLQWREEIRDDLKCMVPPEPDERDSSNFTMKFKFPDGMQVRRKFSPTSSVKVYIITEENLLLFGLFCRNC